MADPTSKVRQAVAETLIPSSSALGQTIAANKAREEAQLAADEANNLVMQREAVSLPPEVQAFTSPQAQVQNAPQPQEEFVNPGQTETDSVRTVASAPLETPANSSVAAPTQDSGIPDNSGQTNKLFGGIESQTGAIDDQIAKVQQEKQAAIQARIDEDDKAIQKVEPKDYFAGKSTWQKILGGIGMFLGSITPEGARNVASIIEKEINRDLDVQKTNLKLQQDKSDKSFQHLMEKYGSQETALLAKKRDAFTLLDLQLKKLEMNARNAETRARIGMGREEIALRKEQLTNELVKAAMKQNLEAAKGAVPGYRGTIQDPTAAREFRTQLSNAKSAYQEIDNLLKINKETGSSFSPSARASAGQSQALLLGQLREILVGPGSMSEGDRSLMEDAIANPTSFFTLASSNKIKLDKLKQSIQRKIEANASAYGLQKDIPQTARKIQ